MVALLLNFSYQIDEKKTLKTIEDLCCSAVCMCCQMELSPVSATCSQVLRQPRGGATTRYSHPLLPPCHPSVCRVLPVPAPPATSCHRLSRDTALRSPQKRVVMMWAYDSSPWTRHWSLFPILWVMISSFSKFIDVSKGPKKGHI